MLQAQSKVWYREPWFWLVMSPLLVVILASLTTVGIAVFYADDVVSDNYYREGRLLAQEFTSEEYAAKLGLAGVLEFDLISGEVFLQLNQAAPAEVLNLLISHPAKAARDQRVELRRMLPQTFRADLAHGLEGRWYLRLTAANDAGELWRLHGEVDFARGRRVELR